LANARAATAVAEANEQVAAVTQAKTASDLKRDTALFASNAITDLQLTDSQANADVARTRWEAAQREADAARERHAATEREINRHAARKSALTEARTRLAADRSEALAAHESANAALAELPPSLPTETRLAEVKTGIDGCRELQKS